MNFAKNTLTEGDFMYNYYSYRKKKPLGLIITVCVCVFLILLTAFFIFFNLTEPLNLRDKKIDEDGSQNVSKNNIEKNMVLYDKNAELHLTEYFVCGHRTISNTIIPDNFISKTIDQIKEENPNIEVTGYNENSISAIRYSSMECDNHFIIILRGNSLVAYNKKDPSNVIKSIKINLIEYSSDDIAILKGGIEVNSQEEMLEFFEDFA